MEKNETQIFSVVLVYTIHMHLEKAYTWYTMKFNHDRLVQHQLGIAMKYNI